MLVLLIENDECPSSVALSIFFGLPRFVQSASIFGVWKHWGANCFLQHHQSSAKKKTSTWNSVCLIPITQHWRNYKLLTCHITSHQNKNPFPCLFFFLPQMGLWFMLLVRFEHLIATPHTFKLVSNRPTCFFLLCMLTSSFHWETTLLFLNSRFLLCPTNTHYFNATEQSTKRWVIGKSYRPAVSRLSSCVPGICLLVCFAFD